MRSSGGASKSSNADNRVSLTSKQKRRQLPKKSQSLLNAYTNRQIKEHLQSLRDDFSSAFTPVQLTKRLQPAR